MSWHRGINPALRSSILLRFLLAARCRFDESFVMTSKHLLSRRSFLKTLGASAAAAPFVTSGLLAQSPNSVLRHASFGSAGQALADILDLTKFKDLQLVAVAEVDLGRTAELKKKFPDIKVYQDWRK